MNQRRRRMGGRSHLTGMSTPAAASTVASTITGPLVPASDSTLGARLAAASRRAQGLASVSDPDVLAELRELCAAPRPTKRTVAKEQEGPAS
jgi:hypothetical protein